MNFYSKIAKFEANEDGTLTVYGIASSDAEDTDGDIIPSDTIANALPEYFKKGGKLKEMHKEHTNAGVVDESTQTCDESCKTYISATVTDTDAITKVKAGIYKGFSIGGKIIKRNDDNNSIIDELEMDEISLVRRPANEEAMILLAKSEKGDLMEEENVENEALIKESNELRKGMYGVAQLAQIIDDLNWLQESTEWEAECEEDGSPIPDELKAQIKALGATLVNMVAEEVSEIVGEDEELAKAGKEISSANKINLEAIHGHAEEIQKMCKSMHGGIDDAETNEKVEKMAEEVKEVEDITKSAKDEEIEELKVKYEVLEKRLKEIEAMPLNKAILKVVEGKEGEELQKSAKKTQLQLIEEARNRALKL